MQRFRVNVKQMYSEPLKGRLMKCPVKKLLCPAVILAADNYTESS